MRRRTFSPVGRGNSQPRAVASSDYWTNLAALKKREAAEHDANVAGYSVETALSAFDDTRRQKVSKPTTPEEWWICNRFAALARLITGMRGAIR